LAQHGRNTTGSLLCSGTCGAMRSASLRKQKPLPIFSEGVRSVQVGLELVNHVRGDQVSVAAIRCADRIRSIGKDGAVRLMIPAEFQAAEHVLPKVILHRARVGEDPARLTTEKRRSRDRTRGRSTLSEVFPATMQRQLRVGNCEAGIDGGGIRILRT